MRLAVSVRLYVVALPDAVHHRPGHLQVGGKRANAPVGTAVARTRFERRIEDALFHLRKGEVPAGERGARRPGLAQLREERFNLLHCRFGELAERRDLAAKH